MHLRDRGRRERLASEFGEHLLDGPAEGGCERGRCLLPANGGT